MKGLPLLAVGIFALGTMCSATTNMPTCASPSPGLPCIASDALLSLNWQEPDPDRVAQLIAAGASVKVTDQRGHTPLHLALWGAGPVPTDEHLKKLLLVVTYLLQAGANPNALNAAGLPAAYCAWHETLDYGLWEEIFAALFQAGANPLIPTNLGTLLSLIEERRAAFARTFPDCADSINHIAELARSADTRRSTPQE